VSSVALETCSSELEQPVMREAAMTAAVATTSALSDFFTGETPYLDLSLRGYLPSDERQ